MIYGHYMAMMLLSAIALSCSAGFRSSTFTANRGSKNTGSNSADGVATPSSAPSSPFPALRDCQTVAPTQLCGYASLGSNLLNVDGLGSDQSLQNIRLSTTRLDAQVWRNLKVSASCLSQSSFISALWNGGELKASEMILTELSRTQWKSMHWIDSDIRLSHFAEADFAELTVENSCLASINWSAAHFENVSFVNSYAERGNLSGIVSRGSFQFTDGNLSAANLSGAVFEGSVNWQNTNMRGVNLTGVVFKDSVNWQGALLSGATWLDGRVCAEGSIGQCL